MKCSELILLSLVACILMLKAHTINPDGVALLAFKTAIIVPDGILLQWNEEDPDPCGWRGVKCDSTKNVMSLRLPYHRLSGHISPELGKLKHLQYLALHDNNFYGAIPSELGNCTEIRAMHLQNNFLSGSIPPELGSLLNLETLDISSNTLSGSIPTSLENLAKLSKLNLSTNFLVGKIPTGGVLSNFSIESGHSAWQHQRCIQRICHFLRLMLCRPTGPQEERLSPCGSARSISASFWKF
ncbi:unnamed protein product [Victoria cruziana]